MNIGRSSLFRTHASGVCHFGNWQKLFPFPEFRCCFAEAWAFLQGLGSDLTEPSNLLATQTILAKRAS
jgi:hypothetical protein